MFIAIEGLIASGKTTTATTLAESLGYDLMLEEAQLNPFLDDFYCDPARFSLETELCFPLVHYHQIHSQLPLENTVADFSPAKDLVFANMNLAGRDLEVFEIVYEHLEKQLPKPDLVLFLDPPVELALRRALKRGRPFERRLTRSYLEALRKHYGEHIPSLGHEVRVLGTTESQSPQEVADCARQTLLAFL